jgi:cytochrome c
MMRVAALALALVAAGSAAAAAGGGAFYTAQQADEGARIYAVRCAMCHGARLEGTAETPGLTGRFVANWAGRPLGELYGYVAKAMPQPAPGSLSAQDNARLTAFMLRANGYAPGNAPLPADPARLKRRLPPPGAGAVQ